MSRAAESLAPITSLPGDYGIGGYSKKVYEFMDWLQQAGQTDREQTAPCGDTCDLSLSTFAGNPYFIDLENLIEEGVLTREECDSMDLGDDEEEIDYEDLYQNRYILLTMAYERSNIGNNPDFRNFVEENRGWLEDYALFMALKQYFGGQCWNQWPEDIRQRRGCALNAYRRELYFDMEFQQYLQFQFFRQYGKRKAYANAYNVPMIVDIPICVTMGPADGVISAG